MLYFTYLGRTPRRTDLPLNLHVGSTTATSLVGLNIERDGRVAVGEVELWLSCSEHSALRSAAQCSDCLEF